jgi:hypothetical protein
VCHLLSTVNRELSRSIDMYETTNDPDDVFGCNVKVANFNQSHL